MRFFRIAGLEGCSALVELAPVKSCGVVGRHGVGGKVGVLKAVAIMSTDLAGRVVGSFPRLKNWKEE